jgi:hypothetical protein
MKKQKLFFAAVILLFIASACHREVKPRFIDRMWQFKDISINDVSNYSPWLYNYLPGSTIGHDFYVFGKTYTYPVFDSAHVYSSAYLCYGNHVGKYYDDNYLVEIDITKDGRFDFTVLTSYLEYFQEDGNPDPHHTILDTTYYISKKGNWLWQDKHEKLVLNYDDGPSEIYDVLECKRKFIKLQRVVGNNTYVFFKQIPKGSFSMSLSGD